MTFNADQARQLADTAAKPTPQKLADELLRVAQIMAQSGQSKMEHGLFVGTMNDAQIQEAFDLVAAQGFDGSWYRGTDTIASFRINW